MERIKKVTKYAYDIAKANDWGEFECCHGYGIFDSEYPTHYGMIDGQHIERIDIMGTWMSDITAAQHAEKNEGIKIIRDIPKLYKVFLDTPENRAKIMAQIEGGERKSRLILTQWGVEHHITFKLSKYINNDNLYVGMITHTNGHPWHYGNLTVNLDMRCPDDCAFIDTNNNPGIIGWLEANNLGKRTYVTEQSGFCAYEMFHFNMAELMKYAEKEVTE